ncbi:MAG: sensor histidine kinase [Bryobacterales bacterium]|nr:sensor histidine kinase [Bryobacterales bacterium]
MASKPIFVSFSWQRGFGIARLALSVCAIALLFFGGTAAGGTVLLATGIYLIFSVAAVLRVGAWRSGLAALPFVADLSFFFVLSMSRNKAGAWLAAASFAFTVLNAAVLRGWREAALGIACAAVSLAVIPSRPELLAMAVVAGGAIALVLAFYITLLRDRLDSAAAQSVHYRALAENVRLDERQRIAADFHDGPLQSFIGFQMRLEILRKLLERNLEAARDELAQIQELCRDQVTELRAFVREMRQAETGSGGLSASMRRLVEVFQKDSGIPATFVGSNMAGPEEPEAPMEVLQIVREALHNVQKHSKASRVAVAVARSAGGIEISIDDDGSGFPFSGTFSLEELEVLHLGPVSIKRRVGELGGDLTVESRPGRGASLRIRVPL